MHPQAILSACGHHRALEHKHGAQPPAYLGRLVERSAPRPQTRRACYCTGSVGSYSMKVCVSKHVKGKPCVCVCVGVCRARRGQAGTGAWVPLLLSLFLLLPHHLCSPAEGGHQAGGQHLKPRLFKPPTASGKFSLTVGSRLLLEHRKRMFCLQPMTVWWDHCHVYGPGLTEMLVCGT